MIKVTLTSQGERTGTVTLDANGVAQGDTPAASAFIEKTIMAEPITTDRLTPINGNRYMRAMPANLDNAYFWATFYDDGKIVKEPWRRSQGGSVEDPPQTDWEKAQEIVANSKYLKFVKPPPGRTVVFLGTQRAADAFKKNIGHGG